MTQGRHSAVVLVLSAEERRHLEHLQRCTSARQGLQRRARLLLLLDDGCAITATARLVGMGRRQVYKWISRWEKEGVQGLEDKPGRGKKTRERGAHT